MCGAWQAVGMTEPVRNLVDPAGLSDDDGVEALARIAARDAGLACLADHAYPSQLPVR